jgi:hypothetical protein
MTVLQIARALGRSKQAVAKALAGVPASVVQVDGKPAHAWSLDQLPRRYQRDLTTAQKAGPYRTLAALIENPPRRWSPPVPLSSVPDPTRRKAEQLREALRPVLERKDHPLLSVSELLRTGLENYQRVFGCPVGVRQWNTLWARTISRDANFEDWDRLEIYLDERAVASEASPRALAAGPDLEYLAATVAAVSDCQKPSTDEKSAVWLAVTEILQRAANKPASKRIKAQIIQFLFENAPWIGRSRDAIRVSIGRKMERLESNPNPALALRDGRTVRADAAAAENLWAKDDVDRIAYESVRNHGGRESEAVRALVNRQELSPESLARLAGASRNKSYVPHSLRGLVTPQVDAMQAVHQGPKAGRLVVPYIDRDYSEMASMEQIQSDDFTMPVYFYLGDGNGGFRLTRGQCLIAIDVRSLRILSWVLIPEEQYTALSIRTLFTRTFEQYGLPRVLYLENGIWKTSRMLTGGVGFRRGSEEGKSPLEMEVGLRALGIDFVHARRPQAKVIEKIGDLVQNRMHAERGYCGRDERRDCPEVTKRAKLAVAAGRVHPAEHFQSFEEWNARLGVIFQSYNSERHGSGAKVIPGLSPDEAFEKFWPAPGAEPLRIGPEARHLLANIKRPVVCKASGITLEVGGEKFRYFSGETGKRQGETLIAWFNPEFPGTCTFTDERGRGAFTVERSVAVSAAGNDPQLGVQLRNASAHAAAPKSRYNVLKARFEPKFRRLNADRPTAELAGHLEVERANSGRKQADERQRGARVEKLSRRAGVPVLPATQRSEEGLNMMIDGLAAMETLESKAAQ